LLLLLLLLPGHCFQEKDQRKEDGEKERERERETTAQTPRFFTNDDVFGQQISR